MCDAIAPENWAFQITFNSFHPPARNENWNNYQAHTIIMLDSSATDLGCCYKYSCPLNAVPSLVHIVSSKLPSRACKLPTSLQCDHLCSQRQTFVHGLLYSPIIFFRSSWAARGIVLEFFKWQGSWVAKTLLLLGCVCWLSWQACQLKQMLPPATSTHLCLVSPRWKALALPLHLRAAARWWRPWTRTVCALSSSLEATRVRWWRTRCSSPRSAAVPTSLASDAEVSEEIIIPVLNCVPHYPSSSPTHTWMGLLPFSWILLECYTSNSLIFSPSSNVFWTRSPIFFSAEI